MALRKHGIILCETCDIYTLIENLSKFELAVEAIIIFVKNIKEASGGMFTLLVSQKYELS